ncbi:MAG: hypothetical protein J0L99_05975 [Chitinophagales bacterium]|nr:hypothetical protein [Chitinophagales bacterium]
MAQDTTINATYTPQYFLPDVYAVQNYYAFGQNMPKWSSSALNDPARYRFGYNGKEDDDEWNKQDYGFRIYDTRLARFLSVDPLTRQYAELTPYQFASNSPISGVDMDGLEYYYAADGRFVGQIGSSETVRLVNVENIATVSEYITWTNTATRDDYRQFNYQKTLELSSSFPEDFSTLRSVAATAYSESGYAPLAEMGIANAIVNHHKILKQSGLKRYADGWRLSNTLKKIRNNLTDQEYAASNPAAKDFFNTSLSEINSDPLMLTGFDAAINAISGGIDYSDGAVGWHGIDIITNATWMKVYGIDFITNSSNVEIGLFENARKYNKVTEPLFEAIKTVEGFSRKDKALGTAATLFYKPSRKAWETNPDTGCL